MPGLARYGFEIHFSISAQLIPDEQSTFVTIEEEDSSRGFIRARLAAIHTAAAAQRATMITRATLLHCEL